MQARHEREWGENLLHAHVHEICRHGWLGCQEGVKGFAEKAQTLHAQVCGVCVRERVSVCVCVCVCVCVYICVCFLLSFAIQMVIFII